MMAAGPTAPARRSQPFVRLFLLAAAFAMLLLTTCPALAQADSLAAERESNKAQAPDDKKDENGKDKEKKRRRQRQEKEEMQKILQLVAEGKMTVEQALAKLAEKSRTTTRTRIKTRRRISGSYCPRDGTSTLKPPLLRFPTRIRRPVLRSQQPGHGQRSRGNDYRGPFSRRAVMARRRVSCGFADVAGLRPE